MTCPVRSTSARRPFLRYRHLSPTLTLVLLSGHGVSSPYLFRAGNLVLRAESVRADICSGIAKELANVLNSAVGLENRDKRMFDQAVTHYFGSIQAYTKLTAPITAPIAPQTVASAAGPSASPSTAKGDRSPID
ncbi:hypothetical protein N7467_011808 [Penicillium canescens]|nr:hypothetical protein N7467_011808 [Penicillium canescens]